MTDRTGDVLRTFPPRPPNPDERAVVAEWLAATCNVASAYVSERRGDDPATYRRIVIAIGPERTPSFLVHAPAGMTCWLVSAVGHGSAVKRFDNLRGALNSIRAVFPE